MCPPLRPENSGRPVQVPFTYKKDLRDNYPFGMFAVPRNQLLRVHASSGTTGKPTVVGYTARDIDTWANLVARSIRAAGGRPVRPAVDPGPGPVGDGRGPPARRQHRRPGRHPRGRRHAQ